MNDFLRENPLTRYPPVLQEMKQIQDLSNAKQSLFTQLDEDLEQCNKDMYFSTASEKAIAEYEKMAGIIFEKGQDLKFRRERVESRFNTFPPFCIPFYCEKFDEIIGAGKWKAKLNKDRTVLILESTAKNQYWLQEIIVTINNTKPATLIFKDNPTLYDYLAVDEEISQKEIYYKYKLGAWKLGQEPFGILGKRIETVRGGIETLTNNFLHNIADFCAKEIHHILINDSIVIEGNDFRIKAAADNEKVAIIEYLMRKNDLKEITNIKTVKETGEILTNSDVYVPFLLDDLILTHKITVKEV